MKQFKKYITLALCVAFGVFITFFELSQTSKKRPGLEKEQKQALLNAITKEEKRIWQELHSLGIERMAIEKAVQENLPALKECEQYPQYKNLKPANARTIKFVHQVLNILDRNVSDVKILQREGSYPACAVGNMIIIDEKVFWKFSHNARTFMIAHEFYHIYHRDGLVGSCIKEHTGLAAIDQFILGKEKPQHPFCQYLRFKEWRADVYALLNEKMNMLPCYQDFCKEIIAIYGSDHECKTHPSNQSRLLVAQALHNGIVQTA